MVAVGHDTGDAAVAPSEHVPSQQSALVVGRAHGVGAKETAASATLLPQVCVTLFVSARVKEVCPHKVIGFRRPTVAASGHNDRRLVAVVGGAMHLVPEGS
jgi:hypothetical protein